MAKLTPLTGRRLTMGTAGVLLGGLLIGCGVSPDQPGPATDQPVPATDQPPPISGGTLLITHNDITAVAADPDRDAVWLVDLQTSQVRTRVVLPAGSEPGRAIEDQDGNVHVALRRGGQVVKIDPQSGTVLSRRPVCPAPRGLAYDATTDNLHVVCVGGELVTIKARGGDTLRTIQLDRDLRDVVMSGNHLLISRFRNAELLEVDAAGALVGRAAPRQSPVMGALDAKGRPITTSPNTAWRLAALPDGSVLMLHQRALDNLVSVEAGGYGAGPCFGGIVNSAMTIFDRSGGAMRVGDGAIAGRATLAVDVAVSGDGQQLTLIGAAAILSSQVISYSRSWLAPMDPCQTQVTIPPLSILPETQVIAGAYDGKGQLWLQGRNPARLYGPVGTQPIKFPAAEDRSSEGHRLFHSPTANHIACASCHAEAGDDGHVWTFDTVGPRRTQSLRGGILATAPFHWDGDMGDFTTLMNQVFTGRMGGQKLTPELIAAVGAWVDAQPVLPKSAPRDPDAVARGRTVFSDSEVGCAGCHSGSHFTNNQSIPVGTGKSFQVPSLTELVGRAPYLHSGCAATLRDRFDPACGGGDNHGKTAQLAATQIDDLIAYLESL